MNITDLYQSKVSSRNSINSYGTEGLDSRSYVQNATEGSMNVSKNSIVRKEMESSTDIHSSSGVSCTTIETDKINYTEILNPEQMKEDGSDVNDNDNTADRVTSDDCEDVEEEGYSIEKFDADRLERTIERIKSQRSFEDDSLEKYNQNQEVQEENLQKVVLTNLLDGMNSAQISEQLEASNLPATTANVQKFINASEMSTAAEDLTENGYQYLIQNNCTINAKNIYQAKYMESSRYQQYEGKKQATDVWNEIEPQVKELLQSSGLEDSEQNFNQAKWLYENNLPVTSENIVKLNGLEELKNSGSQEKILEKMLQGYERGIEPDQVSLIDTTESRAAQAVQEFQQIPDEAVDILWNDKKEINLKNLLSAADSDQTTTVKTAAAGSVVLSADTDIEAVRAKRQLEEIRLKMTTEAAVKLCDKGIDLHTDNLQKIVEGLKEIEKDYYKNLLKDNDIDASDNNVTLLQNTSKVVESLKSSPADILSFTLGRQDTITLGELSSEGDASKAKYAQLEKTYEPLATAPRKDLGDSIQKAFKNVDHILNDLGYEATEANRRAVRILGYNQMQITSESIESMKTYDAKVNFTLENLQPSVTMEMIRNQENPLDIPIDELNQKIEDIQNEIGCTEEEKFSKYLWKLDKKDGINVNERKSYIGVYRLLNQIQKSDGAAIGAVVNQGQEITLGSLLTAIRSEKSTGMNKVVDDTTGTAEKSVTDSKSIYDQIMSNMTLTGEYQVKEVLNHVTPDILKELETKYDNIYNVSLEQITQEIKSAEDDMLQTKDYYNEKAEKVRDTLSNPEEAKEILGQLSLPQTIQNLSYAKDFLKKGVTTYKDAASGLSDSETEELQSISDHLIDNLDEEEELENQYTQADEYLNEVADSKMNEDSITFSEFETMRLLKGSITFAANLRNSNVYEIPVFTKDSITNINLTINHDSDRKGQADLTMDSGLFGEIEAKFQMTDDGIQGYLISDKQTEDLKSLAQNIESELSEKYEMNSNIMIIQSNVRMKSKTGGMSETDMNTKKLYQAAKTAIQEVRKMESSEKKGEVESYEN